MPVEHTFVLAFLFSSPEAGFIGIVQAGVCLSGAVHGVVVVCELGFPFSTFSFFG